MVKLFKSDPVFITFLWISIVAIVLFNSDKFAKLHASSTLNAEQQALVLQPKDSLAVEQGKWAFAPDVPAPIARPDQRRVVVNWTISEFQQEIAPGVTYDTAWGFEGRIPGPVLRVRVGDLVEFHITNHIKSMNSHNMDFHFVSGPGGGAGALSVAPGQTATLEARAMVPGFFMYHCASPDLPSHIANGMYGFVIVDPAGGLPPVGKEMYLVQSEFYTKDGNPGHQSLDLARADKEDPQYVVFNGAVGSLMGDKAPQVALSQPVRLYVGNAGPNMVSSFHVIGQIFDKVYREGDLISPPASGVQTTLIPAGGSTVVEFTPQVPGKFMMVDHAIFRVHRGAVGSLVVNGAPNPQVFDPITAGASAYSMAHDNHGAPMANMDMPAGSVMSVEPATVPDPGLVATTAYTPEQRRVYLREGLESGVTTATNTGMPMPGATPPPITANTIRIAPGAGDWSGGPLPKTYLPTSLTIHRGTTVTWVNTDTITHVLKDDNGRFQSEVMYPNGFWAHKFTEPGVYHFTCIPHPWMKGTLVVR